MSARKWDREEIKSEVARAGKTLTGIARDKGLYPSACRAGLIGASRAGAEAIAEAIGVPFRDLFPDSYTRGRHDEEKINSNKSCNTSAKRTTAADSRRSVA